jgi:hypothetical protein
LVRINSQGLSEDFDLGRRNSEKISINGQLRSPRSLLNSNDGKSERELGIFRKSEFISENSASEGSEKQEDLELGVRVFDGSRKKNLKPVSDRRLIVENGAADDSLDISSVFSEPDRDKGGLQPVRFKCLLPALGGGKDERKVYKIENLTHAAGIDWRQCTLATSDLRLMENLATCHACFVNRPLSLYMSCGHGGMCLRCSVKQASVLKLCPYCGKVGVFNEGY